MKVENSSKQIYIVISQTGTILSRILKRVTYAEYNHASISLSKDLETMYSFGRVHPYNPFWGGFVMESPNAGTFKRFSETKVLVLAVNVSEERYIELKRRLSIMWLQRKKYHYNYYGLGMAAFHIKKEREYCYYCSEFVKDILLKCQVEETNKLPPIVQPMDFLQLPHTKIYSGKLKDYCLTNA